MNMKIRLLVVFLVVAALLLAASMVSARTKLAEITVKNPSAHPVYLVLTEAEEDGNRALGVKEYAPILNGEWYYLPIPAQTDLTFTVKRAIYMYTLSVCGGEKEVSDVIDINNGGVLRVPKLCEYFWIDYEEALVVDDILTRSEDIAFTLKNYSDNTVNVVLSGPETVSVQIESGYARDLVVKGGVYTMTANPCDGKTVSKTQQLFFHRVYHVCAP